MLWPSDALGAVFAQIKRNSQATELSTLIITSLETDAICATEILSEALKSENVLHTVYGVSGGFSQLNALLIPLISQQSFKCVVLINCGGQVDLATHYGEYMEEGSFIFVIDSHRPLAHQNILPTTNQVIVLGGEISKFDPETMPSEDLREDYTDDEEEEEEAEEEQEEEAFGEDSRASAVPSSNKRLRRLQRRQEWDNLSKLHQEYYAGSYLGDPSSHVMFQVCSQAGKETSSVVWSALVGITYRYALSQDLDDTSYAYLLHEYQQLVENKNIHVKLYRQSVDDKSTRIPNASAQDQIEYVPHELNLVLYRNWSLAEACKHTERFAIKFRAWSAGGSGGGGNDMQMFFARMGLSLSNAEQKFQFMDRKAKRIVRDRIVQTALDFGYERMSYPSFIRRSTGYDLEVSAEDCARCIQTLLDDANSTSSSNGGENALARCAHLLKHGRRDKREWNRALDACLQRVRLLHAETLATVQNGLIQSAGDFRWAFIDLHEEDGDGDGEDSPIAGTERGDFFSSASGVVALAQAVIRANFDKWVNRNSVKPLVLAVSHRGKALVCGLPCPSELGIVQKNPFGQIFRNTVEDLQLETDLGEFHQDFVLRLNADDVQRFLLNLAKT